MKHSPPAPGGHFWPRIVQESRDIDLVALDGTVVARVVSKASGHENAPDDDAALRNARLLAAAPRMRDALEIVLEREHGPMHPLIADDVRRILTAIEEPSFDTVTFQREMAEKSRQIHQGFVDFALRQLEESSMENDTEQEPEFGW